MKVLVTGASGYIGKEVTKELIKSGHSVVGMTTSKNGADMLASLGAIPFIAKFSDTVKISQQINECDGVIHLAFMHDFANHAASIEMDYKIVKLISEQLIGKNKPFVTTSHAMGQSVDEYVLSLKDQKVRSCVVSLAPSVHGKGDKAFIPTFINISRRLGYVPSIENSCGIWPAVHRIDAAKLYVLALESAPSASFLDATAESAIKFNDIEDAISKEFNLPIKKVSYESAQEKLGMLANLITLDLTRDSKDTQKLLNWHPSEQTLIEDIKCGIYSEEIDESR